MSEKTTKVLAVRNEAQKVLFDGELKGQISDGFWENAEPHDHWVAWCDAEVIVDPTNVGRDFDVRKDAYAFSHPSLLEVIGDRMLESVQAMIAVKFPGTNDTYTKAEMVADLNDLRKIIKVRTTFAPVAEDRVDAASVAPASVAEVDFELACRCRGKWSMCGGAYQAKSATWHLCQACTSARGTSKVK